jgi:predicted O-methyltransferase YrrM
VYNHFKLAAKFIQYWLTASNGKGHGTHSPFVYDFIEKVLNAKLFLHNQQLIENRRRELQKSKVTIEVTDFGAGSAVIKKNKRVVGAMANSSLKPKKYAEVLAKMVAYYKPKNIIELGTSFGVTTSYMAYVNKQAKVTSFEGDENIAKIATESFGKNGVTNVVLNVGNFDETLPKYLEKQPVLDFVFIDGNHAQEPTLRYFEQLKPFLHNNSIVVFDDIHWSKGMENAWDAIKNDALVSESIDLFFIGIVFFRKEQLAKQHFTIRY